VTGKEEIFKNLWEEHLSHQINNLPDFNDVWRALGKHWRKFIKFNNL